MPDEFVKHHIHPCHVSLVPPDAPQQHTDTLGEALADQQLQERNSSLDQKEAEPPQIVKELCTNNEGEPMVLTQDLSIETAADDGSDRSEPNCDVVPTYNSTDPGKTFLNSKMF